MKLIVFTFKDGLCKKTVEFSETANLIYSQNNSAGKTTFLRMIFYALGYPIPSTKGIQFEKMEFWLTVENHNIQYEIYRHSSYLSIDNNKEQFIYSVPTDFYEIHTMLTGCNNKDVLKNLLGAFYMDQEKGWTLLNRGKVIGNISFNIEELVRGLGGKECVDIISRLEEVKRQQKKYEYMLNVSEYQKTIREADENIELYTPNEVINRLIEVLNAEKGSIIAEMNQIKNILRNNKMLADYISNMKLTVQSSSGEEIPVTKDTLVGFIDNNDILTTRREMLASKLDEINKQIIPYEVQKAEDEQLVRIQTAIEAFDSDIKKISVDPIATKRIINRLKRERLKLQDQIRNATKEDNELLLKLHNCISSYAKELDVSDIYISPNKDYIFTNDLKSLSGTILHKIVFSFKLAYIKMIKEKTGIILPIVLDSPSGREVEHSTVEKMLNIIQRDFSDYQLIVASINNYNLKDKKIIEFKDRLFGNIDFLKLDV